MPNDTLNLQPLEAIETARAALSSGHASEAVRLLEAILAGGRGGLFARLLLVRAHIKSGDSERALLIAREVSLLDPEVADAALALGEALLAKGSLPLAIAEFQRALRLDPALDEARLKLAEAWLAAGEPDKAEAALESLAAPDETLRERAAAMRARSRADPGYVRHLFDQFSTDYDVRMLGELGYAAPQILRELAGLVLSLQKDLAVVDLGCGTGLAGAAFKAMAKRLVGVDLSPMMLEIGRAHV